MPGMSGITKFSLVNRSQTISRLFRSLSRPRSNHIRRTFTSNHTGHSKSKSLVPIASISINNNTASTDTLEAIPTPMEIKSLVYLAHDSPILVVLAGNERVSERALCELLDLPRKYCKLAPPDRLKELCGFDVGQVPPYGHPTPLFTIIDIQIATASIVNTENFISFKAAESNVSVVVGEETSSRDSIGITGEELVSRCNARVAAISKTAVEAEMKTTTQHTLQQSQQRQQIPVNVYTTLPPSPPSSSPDTSTTSTTTLATSTTSELPRPWEELSPSDGTVQFFAVIATTRKVARLLVFMNVVPESVLHEEMLQQDISDASRFGVGRTQYIRKLWSHPESGEPCELQLILGKTLERKLGGVGASGLFKSFKAGQRVWVKGIPQQSLPANTSGTEGASGKARHSHNGLDVVVHDIDILSDTPPVLFPRKKASSTSVLPKRLPVTKKYDLYSGPYWGSTEVSDTQIVLVDTLDTLKQAASELCDVGRSSVVGIDSEWQPFSAQQPWSPVALLQIANAQRIFVFDLFSLLDKSNRSSSSTTEEEGEDEAETGLLLSEEELTMSSLLETLLSDQRIVKAGFGLSNDLKRLAESYPHLPCFQLQHTNIDNITTPTSSSPTSTTTPSPPINKAIPVCSDIDLHAMFRIIYRDPNYHRRRISLSHLTHLVLGTRLDKGEQSSDWGTRPLTTTQLRYAAVDAMCLVHVYNAMLLLAPEGLLTSKQRVAELSAGITDLSTLAIPSYMLKYNGSGSGSGSSYSGSGMSFISSEELKAGRVAGTSSSSSSSSPSQRSKKGDSRGDAPPGRVYFQRPTGASQDCECNINALLSFLGRPLQVGGKVGVVRVALSDDSSGKTPNRLPRFPRGGGILEFSNAFLLFVNVPSQYYPNKFSTDAESGGLTMTWFHSKGQSLQHPATQRLLGLNNTTTDTDTVSTDDSSIDSSSTTSGSSEKQQQTVLLVCRPPRGPFVVCGRLEVAAVEEQTDGNIMVEWRLVDAEELQKSSYFQMMMALL